MAEGVFPTIRLTIDSMRHQVVHALSKHHDELEQMVNDEVDRVLRTMEWKDEIQGIIRGEVHNAVKESVERFYKYGEGREYVDGLVKKVLATPA